MFRARMGVSAQALGISQAAYDEALKYAKERAKRKIFMKQIEPTSRQKIFRAVSKEVSPRMKLGSTSKALSKASTAF